MWTHEPSSAAVTNVDNAGSVIADPRTADRGPYDQLVGFMVVRHGPIKVR